VKILKFENTEVFNFDGAFRGMRNPMNSWDKSDSYMGYDNDDLPSFKIGKNDMELAQKLIKAGSDHSKFLRQIMVSVDITAPLYWWKEFDTYKIGTVANSTSTMHKLSTTPITRECFELNSPKCDVQEIFLQYLEGLRLKYLKTKDKTYWKELIEWLPEGWLQTRTVTLNYAVLRNMYFSRENHKLTEWSVNFIKWIESLSYSKELIKGE